uniref:ATP synthase complex subunit 8 n=1 Tax=Coleoptera sp. ACP-2013 TaxID=2485033 RepID=A0A3G3MER5_9COLE|nr:ATP synthase F0 subunit 8 [Coleoptera sp. ACP-2013]
MPQMAPMNWLTLFIYFTIIFIIFNSLNYFMSLKSNKSLFSKSNKKNSLNWKW